jgi:hypothetical protein
MTHSSESKHSFLRTDNSTRFSWSVHFYLDAGNNRLCCQHDRPVDYYGGDVNIFSEAGITAE